MNRRFLYHGRSRPLCGRLPADGHSGRVDVAEVRCLAAQSRIPTWGTGIVGPFSTLYARRVVGEQGNEQPALRLRLP